MELTSNQAEIIRDHIAALVRSQINGSILFQGTIKQTTETMLLALIHGFSPA